MLRRKNATMSPFGSVGVPVPLWAAMQAECLRMEHRPQLHLVFESGTAGKRTEATYAWVRHPYRQSLTSCLGLYVPAGFASQLNILFIGLEQSFGLFAWREATTTASHDPSQEARE